ncbi:ciliary microtubule-associated protein 3 [Rhynchocyon petersi]
MSRTGCHGTYKKTLAVSTGKHFLLQQWPDSKALQITGSPRCLSQLPVQQCLSPSSTSRSLLASVVSASSAWGEGWLAAQARSRPAGTPGAGCYPVPLATLYTSVRPRGQCRMCFCSKTETVVNYSFGTCQKRNVFPSYTPSDFLGNKYPPLRGAPHRGPGKYITEDKYGLVDNLAKIPTSKKGYAFGARTSFRFRLINKNITFYPGMYQKIPSPEERHKQAFAPFNVMVPRCRKCDSEKDFYPGPGTYNPEIKPPRKVTWPMKFGSPDWAQVPCAQKRTIKSELPTDKDFRKQRNRVAYLKLYYD